MNDTKLADVTEPIPPEVSKTLDRACLVGAGHHEHHRCWLKRWPDGPHGQA